MRKQNRNNRICTNEESGKTDFIIDPLLPIGKENAITTQELMRISGCGSSRELRQRIALERERGAIICSGSGRGYWKPKNRQEIQEFIKTMDARAWNTLKAAKGAKKALRTPAKKAELIYEKDKEAAEKQFRTEAAKHFEKAFGKGSCWKVFGTHYPSSTGYAEFINQITALIKKWNVVDQGNEILKDFHGYR